jgi:PAS domain S-box-containing protein
MMGYDAPEELIGKSMFEHTHVDDRELVRERATARQRGEDVPSRASRIVDNSTIV